MWVQTVGAQSFTTQAQNIQINITELINYGYSVLGLTEFMEPGTGITFFYLQIFN